MNPLIVQLTHRPFPDLATAIISSVDQITVAWDTAVRKAMPQMQHLTFDELKDSTPQILNCMADALASDDPEVIQELMKQAPAQGLSRFKLNFDVVEIMQEDRLLRSITVQHVEAFLDRTLGSLESSALDTVIDVMLQRSVIAMVEQQKSQLRAAAETELKFLSFLAHDLNNNLHSVGLTMQMLGVDLRRAGGFTDAEESIAAAHGSDSLSSGPIPKPARPGAWPVSSPIEPKTAIRVEPQRWQLHPWGDKGGGFWVVGVIGCHAVWFNDIEGGFNISRYDATATLLEYRCNQDDLSGAVLSIRMLIDDGSLGGRFGPPQPGVFPST